MVNATDPNWGKLTESLQDVLAPLADRGEWSKWDKIVEDRNARAMEDMRKMAREAFAFYPTEIVDVFINKRGNDAQIRLLKHPEGLAERQESRRRLEALLPVIEAVEKGYTFPSAPGDVDNGALVIRIKAIGDFRENVLRIIQGLDDSIAESEATERLGGRRGLQI